MLDGKLITAQAEAAMAEWPRGTTRGRSTNPIGWRLIANEHGRRRTHCRIPCGPGFISASPAGRTSRRLGIRNLHGERHMRPSSASQSRSDGSRCPSVPVRGRPNNGAALRRPLHFAPLATPREGVRPEISNQNLDATPIHVLMVNGMVAAAGGHATSFAADFELADEAAIAVAQFAQTRHGGPRRCAKRRIHDAVARLERL